jgi:hypothetical protein
MIVFSRLERPHLARFGVFGHVWDATVQPIVQLRGHELAGVDSAALPGVIRTCMAGLRHKLRNKIEGSRAFWARGARRWMQNRDQYRVGCSRFCPTRVVPKSGSPG